MGLDYFFHWTQGILVVGYLILAFFVLMIFLPVAKVVSRTSKDQ